jgi:Flp pilus assembly protein TadB
MIACVAAGASAGVLADSVLAMRPREGLRGEGYDAEQLQRLLRESPVYRHAGVLAEEIAGWVPGWFGRDTLERLAHALDVCGMSPPWKAERFVAARVCEAIALGVLVAAVGAMALVSGGHLPLLAVLLGGGAAAVFVAMSVSSLQARADGRTPAGRGRLPCATALMSLVLQAGGAPIDALQAVVDEMGEHPLGAEFRTITEETRRGRPRKEVLQSFRERFPDPAVKDFVFAIIKGEELGTPLGAVLAAQADEMRRKQSQWFEKQAAEAGVKMSFPAVLVLMACLIVIVGPFILPLFETPV